MRMCSVFIVLINLQTTASICQPITTEGTVKNETLGGRLFIECDISTCENVSKVMYEKAIGDKKPPWRTVFEGFNKTYARAFSVNNYSLNQRFQYGVLEKKHMLYINPLILKDHGKWRCIVYDYNRNYEATAMKVNIYIETNISIKPRNPKLVNGQAEQFTCTADGIHPDPDVAWIINNREHADGTTNKTLRQDGLWFVMNTISLEFDKAGFNELSCVLKTKVKHPWLKTKTIIDVKTPARVLHPNGDLHITANTDSTFTLNCSGTGYDVSWQKDGTDITYNDQRYSISRACSQSVCESSLSSMPVDKSFRCLDTIEYTGSYACVMTLEEPYQSVYTSPKMNVYVPQQLCKDEYLGLILGFGVLIIVIMILVLWVLLLIRMKQKGRNDKRLKLENDPLLANQQQSNELTKVILSDILEADGTTSESIVLDSGISEDGDTQTASSVLDSGISEPATSDLDAGNSKYRESLSEFNLVSGSAEDIDIQPTASVLDSGIADDGDTLSVSSDLVSRNPGNSENLPATSVSAGGNSEKSTYLSATNSNFKGSERLVSTINGSKTRTGINAKGELEDVIEYGGEMQRTTYLKSWRNDENETMNAKLRDENANLKARVDELNDETEGYSNFIIGVRKQLQVNGAKWAEETYNTLSGEYLKCTIENSEQELLREINTKASTDIHATQTERIDKVGAHLFALRQRYSGQVKESDDKDKYSCSSQTGKLKADIQMLQTTMDELGKELISAIVTSTRRENDVEVLKKIKVQESLAKLVKSINVPEPASLMSQ